MNSNKKVYWVLSGEGEVGTWERVETTALGIKQRLTRERCGGDRWAHAFSDLFEMDAGDVAGCDIETGDIRRRLPNEARSDIA